MTNKQRAKIYRKAAQILDVREPGLFGVHLCWTITAIAGFYAYNPNELPELWMLGKYADDFWKPYNDKGSRILALLFCEQIALDSK